VEATLDTRESRKDKKLSHSDRQGTSKSNDKKRKHDHYVINLERPHHNWTEYWPPPGEYKGFLDAICIFHPQGKHKTQDCNKLQGFTEEVLKLAKKANQEKKVDETKNNFLKARKEINYIYGGPDFYESKRKQKLTNREIMTVSPATPEYLKWSEVPITFDRGDHPDFNLKPG
jgi:hypothetical protein